MHASDQHDGIAAQGIFVPRYRDVNAEIRTCCLNAMGRCIVVNPKMYLFDNYLKYLGWQLNDTQSGQVRFAAVHQLQTIYRQIDKKGLECIEVFTARFEQRFHEIPADTNLTVGNEVHRRTPGRAGRRKTKPLHTVPPRLVPLHPTASRAGPS